jgi:predicted RNA-binding protein
MCQASVYLDQEKVMEDAIWLEPTPDGVLVRTFFEGPQVIKGVLQGIDLLKHRVLLSSQQRAPEHKEGAL